MLALLRSLFDDPAPPAPAPPVQPSALPHAAEPLSPIQRLEHIFAREYRELRPRAPQPPFDIRFRRFTSLNTTIRLRDGRLNVRLSDILESAPDDVHAAIAHILLAKLYRRPVSAAHNLRYRRYATSDAVTRRAEHTRQTRGRKRITSPAGHIFDLNEIFDDLNARFFHSLMARPTLTWSATPARRMLGHYDAAHNTIVISRIFDRPATPRFAVEYVLYHEMLHLRHPVTVRSGRRCVHSRAFTADERLFPHVSEAKAFLKRL
jgi:hypothetical protein